MTRIIIFVVFVFICLPAYADLNLNQVHPDESTDHIFNQRFSLQNSILRLDQIDSSLKSFRLLTEFSEGKVPKEKLEEIGNTGWEIQNLGFINWSGAVKGTLYKQEYLIKKLRYELALEKLSVGKIEKSEVITAEKEYRDAEKNFQDFWDSFSIGD